MNDIAANLTAIQDAMAQAAHKARRDPATVKLVAVSKTQDAARIEAALAAGQRRFGENRVQEAQAHWQERRLRFPDLQLHMIGPLQTNKIKAAVALFDVIETLDRRELAQKLAAEMKRQNRDLPCLIQVNTGAEPQKAGVLPDDVADFYDFCHGECGIAIRGLMCIPPVDEEPGRHFALLQQIAARLNLPELSMGMSADYEQAIAYGATSVRVGTALFGVRQMKDEG